MLYPKDRRVRVERSGDRLIVECRWAKSDVWALLVVGLLFLSLMVGLAVSSPRNEARHPSGAPSAIIVIVLLYGGFPTVAGLMKVIGRTRIEASATVVTSKSVPVGLPRKPIPAAGVKQFFVSERRRGSSTLNMIDANDHVHLLAQIFPSPVAAYQVRHELQDYYGLEDLEVYGETTHPDHPGPRPKHQV